MESRRSKKTRSYGEASKPSRDSHQSLSPPTSGSRPLLKDRVKSAPLVAQSAKIKHDARARHGTVKPSPREEEGTQPPPSAPDYPSSRTAGQQESCTHTASVPNTFEDNPCTKQSYVALKADWTLHTIGNDGGQNARSHSSGTGRKSSWEIDFRPMRA